MGDNQPTIEDLLESHRKLIEAEIDRKAAEQERLDEQRKFRIAEQRRAAIVEQLLSGVGHLIEVVSQQNVLLTRLLSQQPISAAIGELTDEIRDGMEHIEDHLRILLEVNRALLLRTPPRKGEGEDRETLIEAIKRATNGESIKRQIRQYRRRLNRLLEQQATYGLAVPAHIQLDIEDTESRISELEEKLNAQHD